MKRLIWSSVIGSVPVLALYWIGRFSHSSGPLRGFDLLWFEFTGYLLIPGYYFLAAIGLPSSAAPISQKVGITLMIVFDCVLWSLVVLVLWAIMGKFLGPGSDARRA